MKYQIGTRVEVETIAQATLSLEFLPGTVRDVTTLDDGLSDVHVVTDEGFLKVVRVGKRGGSRQIRPLTSSSV